MKTDITLRIFANLIRHRVVLGAVVCAVLLGGTAADVYAATPYWEVVSTRVDIDDPDRVETFVRDGYIYISTSRQITVRLYSILGQLITQQTVNPGTTRLKVGGRGVYILKIGALTRRITI